MVVTQRVALVTGASSGIGAAIALRLAREGAFVIATSRRANGCETVCEEIAAAGGQSVSVILDLERPESIATVGERIAESGAPGPVEWLVNNAGLAESAPLLGAEQARAEELAAKHMDVNYHGPRRLIQALAPGMVERGYGRIVSIASSAGLQGYPYVADYCASKHALVGLSRAAALELGPRGVFVNLVCPHYVDTPMTARSIERLVEKTGRTPDEARGFFEQQNPGKRLVTVYEVAEATWRLCSGEENGALQELDGTDV
jgi:NAD(P)-dependent dehydrogenase (short-subunit alcohol dehydrogenase family)